MNDLPAELGHFDQIREVSGGCIGDTYQLTRGQNSFFFKRSPGSAEIEVRGLRLLSQAVRVPEVIQYGGDWVLMEWIDGKGYRPVDLAQSLIDLHQVQNDHFGLDHDNYLGSTLQLNQSKADWSEFFMTQRLEPLIEKIDDPGVAQAFAQKRSRIETALQIEEAPSLTHGDLWSGNLMGGAPPVFIDPAVSYSHREVDLAMMRLFGGFPQEVYELYNSKWPLADGHYERENIYQLYHLLNHLLLFGSSYLSRVLDSIARV